jgi:pimeloyl-ACP methyl ester carboxylesterase
VFPSLLEQGHDVYAIDWLGHGRSDKILRPQSITLELHIYTLVKFFEVTELENGIIAAHDWGGYVPSHYLSCLLMIQVYRPLHPPPTAIEYLR